MKRGKEKTSIKGKSNHISKKRVNSRKSVYLPKKREKGMGENLKEVTGNLHTELREGKITEKE